MVYQQGGHRAARAAKKYTSKLTLEYDINPNRAELSMFVDKHSFKSTL